MTILVVEDQVDVRQLLRTALQLEGYSVLQASSAAEGLECLRRHDIDLVVTDYAMPGGTGTWMLHEATTAGLLEGIPAIIVTAMPDAVEVPERYVVMGKPLDLDKFVQQVRRLLHRAAASRGPAREPSTTMLRTPAHKIELALYISSFSVASNQAKRNLLSALKRYDTSHISLSVLDLTKDPVAGESDHIVYTPTLVKRWPTPSVWIVGDLHDRSVVDDLLAGCGIGPKASPLSRLH